MSSQIDPNLAQKALDNTLLATAAVKRAAAAEGQVSALNDTRRAVAVKAAAVADRLVKEGGFKPSVRDRLALKLASGDGMGPLEVIEAILDENASPPSQGQAVKQAEAPAKSAMKESDAFWFSQNHQS